MSISPLTFIETFSNDNASSWGTLDSGQSWATSNLTLRKNFGYGTIVNMANTGLGTARIQLPVNNVPEQTSDHVLMRVRVSSPAQWPLTDFGPMLSFKNGNTFYYLALQGNWGEIAIGVFINGYRYEMNRIAYPFNKGNDFWVRFRRTSSGMRAKIWRLNQAEPTSWTLTSALWDGSYPPGAGSPGIWKRGTRDSHDIEVLEYYYYASGAAHPASLPRDNFNRTPVNDGWGRSSNGHIWEGHTALDPRYYNIGMDQKGHTYQDTVTTANSAGVLRLDSNNEAASWFGKDIHGDTESYARFSLGGGTDQVQFRLGLRGQPYASSGINTGLNGYLCVVRTNSTIIDIYKRMSDGSYPLIASGTLPFTVVQDTQYRMRFQIRGTTLNARCWTTTEPTTWQVTGTDSTYTYGKYWVGTWQPVAQYRTVQVHFAQALAPTIDAVEVKNFTTVENVYWTARETSVEFAARRLDDENNNATISAKYRPSNATSWIPYTGAFVAAAKDYQFTIDGLQPSTSYTFQVTWQDADGVVGANPTEFSVSTGSTSAVGGGLRVTSTGTDSIGLEATYTRDVDDDSYARVWYRTSSSRTYGIEDYFVDEDDGEYLQNTTSVRGGSYVKHPLATQTVQGVVQNRRIYSNATNKADYLLYYHTTAPSTSVYTVAGEFHAAELNGITGVAGRMSTTADTYYGAGINAENRTWELFRMDAGTKVVLASTPFVHAMNVIHKFELVIHDSYKALNLNGTEILRSDDNTLTGIGYTGYYSTGIVKGATTNQFTLDTFMTSFRTTAGAWVPSTGDGFAMTADRVNKKFTYTATGLAADTIYEFWVQLYDPDGVYGSNILLTSAQTTGTGAALVAMGASPQATSAIVDVFYNYDANNNAHIEFQYRSTMEYLWTSVPFGNVHTDRAAKKFSITLTALSPSLTYEARAYIVDPDGILQGSPTFLTGLFTTKGFLLQDQKSTKHYTWKVYDTEDKYLGTIPDAPEPEFSLHQNGGVTDLQFDLPRKMSELESEGFIGFQNRIDIWTIDPSSDGMGPNLINDPDSDASVGAWTLGANAGYDATGGPDGTGAIRIYEAFNDRFYDTLSSTIDIGEEVPLVFTAIARASGAKLRMFVRAYDVNDIVIDSSDEIAETVGTDWQNLAINYTPPEGTAYVRLVLRNTGRGLMYADKFTVLAKEVLAYRGRIEAYTPSVTEEGEKVNIQVLGLASLLSDDYIEHLQFVEVQPQKDINNNRPNYGAADPADMMKRVVDMARTANPKFSLYYTTDSIQYTGNLMQYTFRDVQVRNCFDKIRTLCPSGWHYFIEPDGLVNLRSQESSRTHVLRIGVEIMRFEVERSIRNLKNYVRVKGRQDEDRTEADGHGSINYIAFNQESIDKYGKRMVFIRDAQLIDPESAKTVGDGRLEEYNREEQRVECYIPDSKRFRELSGSLRGYNIESFRPGDTVIIVDPVAGARLTHWDKFKWDKDTWDIANVFMPLPEPVPIITIQNHGSYAQLQLSERPPSQVGDFSRLFRWMAQKETE